MPQASMLRVRTKSGDAAERRRLMKFVLGEQRDAGARPGRGGDDGRDGRIDPKGFCDATLYVADTVLGGAAGAASSRYTREYIELTRDFHPDEFISKWG
eukprot:355127-Chlamydomonas_euryale.AAC.17